MQNLVWESQTRERNMLYKPDTWHCVLMSDIVPKIIMFSSVGEQVFIHSLKWHRDLIVQKDGQNWPCCGLLVRMDLVNQNNYLLCIVNWKLFVFSEVNNRDIFSNVLIRVVTIIFFVGDFSLYDESETPLVRSDSII